MSERDDGAWIEPHRHATAGWRAARQVTNRQSPPEMLTLSSTNIASVVVRPRLGITSR